MEVFLPFDRFQVRYRGRLSPNHPKLNKSEISQVRLIISDKEMQSLCLAVKKLPSFKRRETQCNI